MPIEYRKKQALFQEMVSVDEAEGLLEWLQKTPSGKVDLAACTHLHAANLQVLMALKPRIVSLPKDARLHTWLETVIKSE